MTGRQGDSTKITAGAGDAAFKRAVKAGMKPLALDRNSSGQDIVTAVLGHYRESLHGDERMRAALSGAGIVDNVVETAGLGYSNRSLGLRLPPFQWKDGRAIREQMIELGILRKSGHEHFRGCVTVPIEGPTGTLGIVGLEAARLSSGTHRVLYAAGMAGGVFAPAPVDSQCPRLIVVSTVLDALAVASAGCTAVVAPGRERGFSAQELDELSGFDVVLVGGEQGRVAEALARRGGRVSLASPGVAIARVVSAASDRPAAFASLSADVAEPQASVKRAGASVPSSEKGGRATRRVSPGGEQSSGECLSVPDEALTGLDAESGEDGHAGSPGGQLSVVQADTEVYVTTAARTFRVRQGTTRRSRTDCLKVVVTVTDQATGRFHMDALDLYHAKTRNSFIEAAAAELHAPASELRAELAQVICAAEEARASTEPTETPPMSDAEREEALSLLTSPDLLSRVVTDLGELGVVGEEGTLAIAYLATISRLAERPFGVLIQSSSAAGKSTVADAVSSLVAPEDLVSFSALTPKSLYYLSSANLSHKVLAIAEEEGASRASYPLKLLVSEGKLSIASTAKDSDTGQLVTHSYVVAGPVSLIMTTTATDIDPELANRLVVLGVDESAGQTRAILAAQRASANLDGLISRLHRDHLVHLHRNAQRLLKPYPVVISDSSALEDFPADSARHRRDHAKVLSIISALTLLNQHSRELGSIEVDGKMVQYLTATGEDVAAGIELAIQAISRRDDMAPQTLRLLCLIEDEACRRAGLSGEDPGEVCFTRRELRLLSGLTERQVRSGLARLAALEYVGRTGSGPGQTQRFSLLVEPADSYSNGAGEPELGKCGEPRQPRRTSTPPRQIARRGVGAGQGRKRADLDASTPISSNHHEIVGEGSYVKVGHNS